jgi:hypothetical protein
MITALTYRTPNKNEIFAIRAIAPVEVDPAAKDRSLPVIIAVVQPASRDAATYLQTAASTGAIPSWIGFPAYHNAGIVRMNRDKLQDAATPRGPHGSARTNSRPVTVNSTHAHRNQRPG